MVCVKMLNETNVDEQLNLQKQVEMLELELKKYLDKDAVSRYGNLKAAHPELAIQVMMFVVQGINAGKLEAPIDDEKFKELLQFFQKPKKEFKMVRK